MLYSLLRLRCHAQRALVRRNLATMVGSLPEVVAILPLPPDGANYSKRCWNVQENKIDVAILTKTPWMILVLPADGHHIITADVANDKPYALRLELCECSVNLNYHLGKTFDLKIHTRQTNL